MADERVPALVAPWDQYVRSRRYAAVVHRLKGLTRAGKTAVPGRRPIGFLPGDDVTPQDVAMAMMAPEFCEGGGGGCTADDQCPDDGNPTCSVEKCENGRCAPPKYPPDLGSCPGDLGWSTEGMTPGRLAAVTCLEDLVAELGGTIVKKESGFRTLEYQTHLYNIYRAYTLLLTWPEAECTTARNAAIYERDNIHHIRGEVAQVGFHTAGDAFDITVSVPNEAALADEARTRCQIVRDVPRETWHWHYIGGN